MFIRCSIALMKSNFERLSQAKSFLTLVAFIFLSGCGSLDYANVSENGELDGRLFVMWVGEGSPNSGDGKFVFVPNPTDPLRFTRRDSENRLVGLTIQPGLMYTDGGSIPRIATVFNGFSPWGYAPAYMVHDWLFIANHCVVDGMATDEQMKIEGMMFNESAVVIAEVIKALQTSGQVAPNDIAASTISSAVAGPISRRLWQRNGACKEHQVSDEHMHAVLRAFPQDAQQLLKDLGVEPVLPPLVSNTEPAVLIGEFGFP